MWALQCCLDATRLPRLRPPEKTPPGWVPPPCTDGPFFSTSAGLLLSPLVQLTISNFSEMFVGRPVFPTRTEAPCGWIMCFFTF